MKRILLISSGTDGTMGMCAVNLYRALCQEPDVEVKGVAVHRTKRLLPGFEEFACCDSGVRAGWGKITAFVRQVRWLKQIKQSFRPDITVSCLNSSSTLSVLSGGKDVKIGIFHSPHFQIRAKGRLAFRLAELEFRHLYSRLDGLFCVSAEVRDSILASFPMIDAGKVKVVRNVHFAERILERAAEPLPADDQMLFGKPVLLYCGRLDRNKAPQRSVLAFARACVPDNTRLVFVGPDAEQLTPELQALAEASGVGGRVHFLGARENPFPYMAHAAALVSSSYSEGLPGVIIESLLLGRPVASTSSSKGVWEIFSCEDNYDVLMDGIYENACGVISSNLGKAAAEVREEDIASLASAMEKVLQKGTAGVPAFMQAIRPHHVARQFIDYVQE